MMADDTAGLMRAVGNRAGRRARDLARWADRDGARRAAHGTGAAARARRHGRSGGRRAAAPGCLGVLVARASGPGPRHQPRYAFERQVEASTRYDGRDRLSCVDRPTLVLHGRQDSGAPYPLPEELHAGIAGSRLVTFTGGHMFLLRGEREQFLATLTDFLG